MSRRFAVRAAIALVIVVITTLGLLHTKFVQRRILARLSNLINAQNGTFSATGLDYNLLRLNFRLTSVHYETAGLRITADRVVINVPWRAVWYRELRASKVQIDGLDIHITLGGTLSPQGKAAGLPRFV